MPTYKIKGTDIFHSEKLYPNGSTIELRKVDAERLADYLEFIKAEPEIPAEELKKEKEKQEKEAANNKSAAAQTTVQAGNPVSTVQQANTPPVKQNNYNRTKDRNNRPQYQQNNKQNQDRRTQPFQTPAPATQTVPAKIEAKTEPTVVQTVETSEATLEKTAQITPPANMRVS